ncbi:MAG: CoB--CoM heterodisulfide reductase iron-sulfur subunit B family protein [Candidatus Odinarchaeia archaeon]
MFEYAFFLGCAVPTRALSYELSARKIAPLIDLKLLDVDEFNCCSPPPVICSIDLLGSLAITARNLCIAEELGRDILTLCNGCFDSLNTAIEYLKNSEVREKVNEVLSEIGKKYTGNVNVYHITQFLYDKVGAKKIERLVTRPMENIKIGVFNGCHLLRPKDAVHFDDPEAPSKFDEIIQSTGAESVYYENKYECCGGTLRGVDDELSLKLVKRKLAALKKANVDAVVTSCPFCFVQLDRGQVALQNKYNQSYEIPVLTVTEFLGLSFGFKPEELGIEMRAVSADKLLKKIKLID